MNSSSQNKNKIKYLLFGIATGLLVISLALGIFSMVQKKTENNHTASDISESVDSSEAENEDKKTSEKPDVEDETEDENTKESTAQVDAETLWETFINNQEYAEYTSDWDFSLYGYYFLDINQDGTDELLFSSEDDGSGFSEYLLCAIVDSSVKVVNDFWTCYGISYSDTYKAIVYSETRPDASFAGTSFCTFDGLTMNEEFSINMSLNMDTYEPEYAQYYLQDDKNVAISEDEYKKFQNEPVGINDWTLIQEVVGAEKKVEGTIELSEYLSDGSVVRVASAMGITKISSDGTYKEYVEKDDLLIGILADSSDVYNQITDINNSGNTQVTLYGFCIGDDFSTVRSSLYQGMDDELMQYYIHELENGKYEFWLGDAAVIIAAFENDKLVSYEYQLRYTG